MKIGLICPYSIAKGGGVKEYVFAMQTELERRGHEVYIITPEPRSYDPAVLEGRKVIFIGTAADLNWPVQHTTIQVSAGLNDEIDAILEQHQFDVLHFHEPWVPMLGRQILSRSQTVNVATFHAAVPQTVMSRTFVKAVVPYTKSVLKYIDAFVATGNPAAEYICSLTDEPVALIPCAIDVDHFVPPKRFLDGRKKKTIYYVGRLEGRKGVRHLIQAFKLLVEKYPEVTLVIAGDGPDREKLEMLVNDLEIQEKVTFLGFVSEEEKLRLYRTSDLFCAPALYGEGFGIVLLEAMSCGLVTVAGDNPGYATVMKGFGELSLVNPRHTAEFARRLGLLLYEKDLRKLWRDWAAKEMNQYTYPAIVSQYEEIYQKAIKSHAKNNK